MNWLIGGKMFTYFYNKFRPVNRVHFINCGVNCSLHISGCCWSVAHWITVFTRYTLFTMRVIYKFTLVWYSSKPDTTHRPTSHLAHIINSALSLATRRTLTAAEFGWWFRRPVLVMATLESQNIFCTWTWSSNQSGGGAILALSSFLNQIHHEKEPEISVGIFSTTWW